MRNSSAIVDIPVDVKKFHLKWYLSIELKRKLFNYVFGVVLYH
jgi:hypothetical protein